jgi:hypothetical protein
MNKSRLLVVLVVVNVLFAFASAGAEAFFGWTLPPALADYARLRFDRLPAPGEVVQFVLLATTVLTAFTSWIGLVSYWRFARPLFLVSLAIDVLHTLVSGPSVRTSVGAMFSVMDATVGGVIIGLVYFSDLARRFERASVETTALPPAGPATVRSR